MEEHKPVTWRSLLHIQLEMIDERKGLWSPIYLHDKSFEKDLRKRLEGSYLNIIKIVYANIILRAENSLLKSKTIQDQNLEIETIKKSQKETTLEVENLGKTNYLEFLWKQLLDSSQMAHQVKALVTKPDSLGSQARPTHRKQELTSADCPRYSIWTHTQTHMFRPNSNPTEDTAPHTCSLSRQATLYPSG